MTEQTETGITFTEAPASFNVKAVSPAGYDIMLTLRDDDTKRLIDRAQKALNWLADSGYSATTNGHRVSNGNGNAGKQEPMGICPIHHVQMNKREKNGEAWWSHKAINPETGAEYWCRGKQS